MLEKIQLFVKQKRDLGQEQLEIVNTTEMDRLIKMQLYRLPVGDWKTQASEKLS